MNDILNTGLFANMWFRYGVLLIIIVPILVVMFNEFIYRLSNKNKMLVPQMKIFRNVILPLVALIVIFTQIVDLGRDTFLLKILETITWIIFINAILAILNVVIFQSGKGLFKDKVPQLFLDIFRVLMVLFGTAIILSTVWGRDLGNMVTALGLGSFVLGLALQDTLGNLFSGIALVYEKPFSEGDWIEVEDQTGRVIEMNWRAIRLETLEKEMIIIPHLVIGQGTIKNYSKPESVHIMKKLIGFAYETPPNNVKEALIEACNATPGILRSYPAEIKVDSYEDYKIEYEVEFAINDFADHETIMDDFMSRVWYTAKRYDLHLPYPQLTIHNSVEMPGRAEVKDTSLRSALNELPALVPISRENIPALEDGSAVHHFGKNEIIVVEGGRTGNLYIILDGHAQMTRKNEEGNVLHVANLSRGDFFGEITLFTSNKSSFTVSAITDMKVITIFSEEVLDLVERNPKFAYYLDEMMDLRRESIKD